MAENQTVAVIQEQIDAAAALDIAGRLNGDESTMLEHKLYYPYFRFDAACSVPILFGRKDTTVTCLVDGINNICATADPFTIHSSAVPVASVLQIAVTVDEATRAARRYLLHHLSRRLRVISAFDLEPKLSGSVYKAFWIAASRRDRIIIDTITGLTHPIRKNAA